MGPVIGVRLLVAALRVCSSVYPPTGSLPLWQIRPRGPSLGAWGRRDGWVHVQVMVFGFSGYPVWRALSSLHCDMCWGLMGGTPIPLTQVLGDR